jgi:general secretion pathway protein A
MYTTFYKLNLDPFRLTPDPRFFFASTPHKRGLYYLRYAFHQREGFGVITGAPGTGKTELMLNLISGLPRQKVMLSKIVTSNLHANDLLELVAASFLTSPVNPSKGLLLKQLEEFFLAKAHGGTQIVLLIDEAHNLSTKALIELSMLSNFQLNERPVLQCFLMGQETLEQKLMQPELIHLKQRIVASAHLQHLDGQETQDYIEHRLRIAGWQGDPGFSNSAYTLIHEYTSGVPRKINALCNRILLFGYLQESHHIDADTVYKVIEELQEEALASQETLPQMSLTLDFSDQGQSEEHTLGAQQAPEEQTRQNDEASETAFADAVETSSVIDVNIFNRNKATKHPANLKLAPTWPLKEDNSEQSLVAHAATYGIESLNSPANEHNAIPNNVHALFTNTPQPLYDATISDDLVVELPEEEPLIRLDSEIEPDADDEHVMIDQEAREHHLYLDSLRGGPSKPKQPFSVRTCLKQFTISKTGLTISLITLTFMWWYLYGPGIDSTIHFLSLITDLIR